MCDGKVLWSIVLLNAVHTLHSATSIIQTLSVAHDIAGTCFLKSVENEPDYCKVAGSNLTCRDDSKTRWWLHSVNPTSTGLSSLSQNIIHSSIARVVYG